METSPRAWGKMEPGYIQLHNRGLLQERAREAKEILRSCQMCPRLCKVDRTAGQKGFCRTGERAVVSSYNPHFGEEAPLVGNGGSGTIFFTHCNLLCIFCQNYEISHQGLGDEVSPQVLARMMVQLQNWGCHNINFVTPSHVVSQILEALPLAVELGLKVPLVYNTGGYDRVETLRLLEGVVDIYMPDIKFLDSSVAERFCRAPDYPDVVKSAVREMHRQVGDLVLDSRGDSDKGAPSETPGHAPWPVTEQRSHGIPGRGNFQEHLRERDGAVEALRGSSLTSGPLPEDIHPGIRASP